MTLSRAEQYLENFTMSCKNIAPLVVLYLALQAGLSLSQPADYIQSNPCYILNESASVVLHPTACSEDDNKNAKVADGLYRLFVYDHGPSKTGREPETEVVVGIEKNSICSIYVRSSLDHSELLFFDVCNSTTAWSSEYTIPTRNRLHLATLVPGQYETVVECKDVGDAPFLLEHDDEFWEKSVSPLASSDAFKCIEGTRFGNGGIQGPFKAIRVYNRLRRYNFAILIRFSEDDGRIVIIRLYVPKGSVGKTSGLCGRQSAGSCNESNIENLFDNWKLDKADQRPLYRHNFVYAHRIGWPLNP